MDPYTYLLSSKRYLEIVALYMILFFVSLCCYLSIRFAFLYSHVNNTLTGKVQLGTTW